MNDHVPICIAGSHMYPIFIAIWAYPCSDPGCLRLHRGAWRLHHRKRPDLCGAEVQEGRRKTRCVWATGRRKCPLLVWEATKSTVISYVLMIFNVNNCCFDKCYLTWLSSAKCHRMSMVYSWNDVDVEIQMLWLVTKFIQCLLSNHH